MSDFLVIPEEGIQIGTTREHRSFIYSVKRFPKKVRIERYWDGQTHFIDIGIPLLDELISLLEDAKLEGEFWEELLRESGNNERMEKGKITVAN